MATKGPSLDNVLGKAGGLPKQIGDVTENISKGIDTLDKMMTKLGKVINVPGNGRLQRASDAIKDWGQKASQAVKPWADAAKELEVQLDDLSNCKDVAATSALVVDAVVDSCTGHFHARANEQALSKFDSQWDSWAKTVNGIFEKATPAGQANILEALAKENFGDNVFYMGSAIKNESAGIFGGIADFEDSLHAFHGSYRNPKEAVKKISQGVTGIVKATERVARSIDNMIKTYQKGMEQDVTGNPILSRISDLHSNKAVGALATTLTVAGAGAAMWDDGGSLLAAIKNRDWHGIYNAGKRTYKDGKDAWKAAKKGFVSDKTKKEADEEAKEVKELAPNGNYTGGAAPIDASVLEDDTAAAQGAPVPAQDAADEQDGQAEGGTRSGQNDGDEKVNDGDDKQEDDKKRKKDSGNKSIMSAHTDSYVCSGATMRCTQGTSKARLTVLPTRTVFLTGQPMANISDHLTMVNLAPFGRCRSLGFPATAAATAAHHGHLTPMPCMHNTPFPWMRGKDDYIVKGDPALLKSSTCSCMWGGTISLVTDGQHETGSADLSHQQTEEFETDQPKKNGLDVDSVLDGIQLALDAAGFVPGFGAIPDLTNAAISALRGDWAGAGMSVLAAVPGIGDAAAAAKIAGKGVKAAKAASAAGKAGKAAKDAKAVGKVAEASKQAEKAGATAAKSSKGGDVADLGKYREAKEAGKAGTANSSKGGGVADLGKYREAKGAGKTGAANSSKGGDVADLGKYREAKGAGKTGAVNSSKGGDVADMGKFREAKEARKNEVQAHWQNKETGSIEVTDGGGNGMAPVRKEATNDAPSYRDYSPKQQAQQPSAVKAGSNSTYSQSDNTIRNSVGGIGGNDPFRVNPSTGSSRPGMTGGQSGQSGQFTGGQGGGKESKTPGVNQKKEGKKSIFTQEENKRATETPQNDGSDFDSWKKIFGWRGDG